MPAPRASQLDEVVYTPDLLTILDGYVQGYREARADVAMVDGDWSWADDGAIEFPVSTNERLAREHDAMGSHAMARALRKL